MSDHAHAAKPSLISRMAKGIGIALVIGLLIILALRFGGAEFGEMKFAVIEFFDGYNGFAHNVGVGTSGARVETAFALKEILGWIAIVLIFGLLIQWVAGLVFKKKDDHGHDAAHH